MRHRHLMLVSTCAIPIITLLACGDDGPAHAPHDANEPDGAVSTSSDAATEASAPDASPFCEPIGTTWKRCTESPLARPGAPIDGKIELSVGDPDIFYDDEAKSWLGFWSTGVAQTYTEKDPEVSIKRAVSADGVAWTVTPGTVLRSRRGPSYWDHSKVETPSIVKIPWNPPERRWALFYSGGNDVSVAPVSGFTWYEIGVAFSADGEHFTRPPESESPYFGKGLPYANVEGLVIHGKDVFGALPNLADGLVADPEAIVVGDTIHLFFSSYAVDASRNALAYGVSHATSKDGVHWTFQANNPHVAGAHPTIVKNPARAEYELFVVSDSDVDKAKTPSPFNPYLGVYRITSKDLLSFSALPAERDFTWDPTYVPESLGLVAAGDMVVKDGVYRYYYAGFSPDSPPPGFLAPLRDGGTTPAAIVMSLAARR